MASNLLHYRVRMKREGQIMRNYSSLLIIMGLCWLNIGQAELKKDNCLHKRNKICHSIIKLNDRIDHKEAYKLSNVFSKVSKIYKLDPKLLVSIAFQESSFNGSAVRKVSGLVFDEEKGEYKKLSVGADFCMMQIHMSNIKKMKLDVNRLLTDKAYCIEAGAKILSRYKKQHSKTDKSWWTYYNAKTKAKRDIYFNKVVKHLDNIQITKNREIASQ